MVQKVAVSVSSGLGFAMQRLKTLSVNPAVKWVSEGRIRQQKERDGLCLSSAVHKIQWD